MKEEWFKDFKPKRDYGVYVLRRQKERAGIPITQADSDFYIRKKRIKAKRTRIKAKKASKSKEAGRSKPAIPNPVSAAGPSVQPTVPSAGRSARPPSPSLSLDSVLNSDYEMNATNTLHLDDDVDKVQGRDKKIKRKHRILSSSSTSPTTRVTGTKTGEEAASTKRLKLHAPTPVTATNESLFPPPSSASTSLGPRLAGMGKIPKRKEGDVSVVPTFGQPEPGILDAPLSTPPHVTQQRPIAPEPAVKSAIDMPEPGILDTPLFTPPEVTQQRPIAPEPAAKSAIDIPSSAIVLSPPAVSAVSQQLISEDDSSRVPEAPPATPTSAGMESLAEASAIPIDQAASSRAPLSTQALQLPQLTGKTQVIDATDLPESSRPPSSLSRLPPKTQSRTTSGDIAQSPISAVAPPHDRAHSFERLRTLPMLTSGSSSSPEAPPERVGASESKPKLPPTSPMHMSGRPSVPEAPLPKLPRTSLTIPPSQRGLYVQPKKIVLLDDVHDARLPRNRNEISDPGNGTRKDSNMSEMARITQPPPLLTNLQPKPKFSAYTPRIALPVPSIPVQPRAWNVQEPSRDPAQWVGQSGAPLQWPKVAQSQVSRPPNQSVPGPGTGISQSMAVRAFSPGPTDLSPSLSVAYSGLEMMLISIYRPQGLLDPASNVQIPLVPYDTRKDPRL